MLGQGNTPAISEGNAQSSTSIRDDSAITPRGSGRFASKAVAGTLPQDPLIPQTPHSTAAIGSHPMYATLVPMPIACFVGTFGERNGLCASLATFSDSCCRIILSSTNSENIARVARLRSSHARRSLMMSATRKALAMMVSVGLTAPMDGKKLASVT